MLCDHPFSAVFRMYRSLCSSVFTLYQIQVLATVHQHLQILHSHRTKRTFFSGYSTIRRKIKQSVFYSTNEKGFQTYRVVHNADHSCQVRQSCRTASSLELLPMFSSTIQLVGMEFYPEYAPGGIKQSAPPDWFRERLFHKPAVVSPKSGRLRNRTFA